MYRARVDGGRGGRERSERAVDAHRPELSRAEGEEERRSRLGRKWEE